MTDIPNILPESRADTILRLPTNGKLATPSIDTTCNPRLHRPTVPADTTRLCFRPDTTLAIAAGFASNRRVMIQEYGTAGRPISSQVAARLTPTVRINLYAHSAARPRRRDASCSDGHRSRSSARGCCRGAAPVALVFDNMTPAPRRAVRIHGARNRRQLTLPTRNRVIRPTRVPLFATTTRSLATRQALLARSTQPGQPTAGTSSRRQLSAAATERRSSSPVWRI